MSKGTVSVGIILLLIGALWALQGVGIVGGSFMTGQSRWLLIGVVTLIAGLILIVWGSRRGQRTP